MRDGGEGGKGGVEIPPPREGKTDGWKVGWCDEVGEKPISRVFLLFLSFFSSVVILVKSPGGGAKANSQFFHARENGVVPAGKNSY